MELQRTCAETLNQLSSLLESLDDQSYSKLLDILSANSVGKHVRHILEFYETMLNGIAAKEVDYDKRERNLLLETNVYYTIGKIKDIIADIHAIKTDNAIKLTFSYAEGSVTTIDTYIYRELAYNIEHTIHHMAIIKIAVNAHFPQVLLPATFGVAYSTIQYQQECAQ